MTKDALHILFYKKQQINYLFYLLKNLVQELSFFFFFFNDIIFIYFKFKEVKCLIAASVEIYYFFHFLETDIIQPFIKYSQLHRLSFLIRLCIW